MAELLDKIRQWGLRFLDKSPIWRPPCSSLLALDRISYSTKDPRELPRPSRPLTPTWQGDLLEKRGESLNHEETAAVLYSTVHSNEEIGRKNCACMNCRELTDNLVDCVICVEPLQGNKIFSCSHCGNIVCWKCAERVQNCPFCRKEVICDARSRNLALEYLLSKLALPCRNSRWGCKEQLHLGDRASHEMICAFSFVGCPWYKNCSWHGDPLSVITHLKEQHMVTVLPGNTITIEISQFRTKISLSERKTRKYMVSLSCFASIFVCKVFMSKRKLRIVFTRISDGNHNKKFGAWLEIGSSFRNLKGIMPIPTICSYSKALDVSCENLISPWKKTDEKVTINITIRPIS